MHDLTKPLDLQHRFDLVVCLEVGEHMPPGTEPHLIDLLDRHAKDYLLFSAAEPGRAEPTWAWSCQLQTASLLGRASRSQGLEPALV